jgi:hypothetical protein
MTNALKGAAVAAVTGFLIASLIALLASTPHDGLRELVVRFVSLATIAMTASITAGTVLGFVAGKLRDQRLVVLEIAVLALVPLAGLVIFRLLGVGPELLGSRYAEAFLTLVVVASAPAAIGTIVLERWTRPALASPRF